MLLVPTIGDLGPDPNMVATSAPASFTGAVSPETKYNGIRYAIRIILLLMICMCCAWVYVGLLMIWCDWMGVVGSCWEEMLEVYTARQDRGMDFKVYLVP
ncbi:hypothetical protein BJX76DRAFT_341947 [Aspergillus varians]